MKAPFVIPAANVETTALGFVATTDAPQLELILPDGPPCGRWIRLRYCTSYLDHLVRPLILFATARGEEWDTMSAGLFGRAEWVGRVPEETRRILISPVDRPGPFGFEIEHCEFVSRRSLLARALRNDMTTAAMSIGARLIDARQETRQALMFARGGVDMADYAQWRARRWRPFEPDGLDAPRVEPYLTPHIRFIVSDDRRQPVADWPLVKSLLAAPYDNWSVCIVSEPRALPERLAARANFAPDAQADDMLCELMPDSLVACVEASDSFADHALPVIAAAAMREPSTDCFYGDEDACDETGDLTAPRFKPDWSPIFEFSRPYLGRPVFWRRHFLMRGEPAPAWFDHPDWRAEALARCGDRVAHIRRILMTRETAPAMTAPSRLRSTPSEPTISIVIPTRDQLALLIACLDGLLHSTRYPSFEIIIVDHESSRRTRDFYKKLADDPSIRILPVSGPFNFSAMCNAAAAMARGACLVFLNNDVEIVEPDWLRNLAELAMRPNAGAVGARLLFPSGAIQHAGVTVGMGGYADHTSHSAGADDAGYLERLSVSHETSAVTGACIAVEARKFRAVGGFDAENLPVELNDIDLCLKLGAKGWTTLMCPDAVLVHHQSASRGFSWRPFTRYGKERRFFRKKWRDAVRDDPYFHPALSLFSVKPALDG